MNAHPRDHHRHFALAHYSAERRFYISPAVDQSARWRRYSKIAVGYSWLTLFFVLISGSDLGFCIFFLACCAGFTALSVWFDRLSRRAP